MSKKLREALAEQEHHLSEMKRRWQVEVDLIRTNPNQMNVEGIWMTELLHKLQVMHMRVVFLSHLCAELRSKLRKDRKCPKSSSSSTSKRKWRSTRTTKTTPRASPNDTQEN